MKYTAALCLALDIMPAYTYSALPECKADALVNTDQRSIIDQVIDGSGESIVQMAKMAKLDVEKQ